MNGILILVIGCIVLCVVLSMTVGTTLANLFREEDEFIDSYDPSVGISDLNTNDNKDDLVISILDALQKKSENRFYANELSQQIALVSVQTRRNSDLISKIRAEIWVFKILFASIGLIATVVGTVLTALG